MTTPSRGEMNHRCRSGQDRTSFFFISISQRKRNGIFAGTAIYAAEETLLSVVGAAKLVLLTCFPCVQLNLSAVCEENMLERVPTTMMLTAKAEKSE
jgi:gamma-glutamylcysteine synthetase